MRRDEEAVGEGTPGAARWRVELEDGRTHRATDVLFAGLSPEAVERIAGRPAGSLRSVAGPATVAACLDLELAEQPETTFALDLDRRFYYSVHSVVARLAPEAHSLASLAYYRSGIEDGARVDHELEAFARDLGAGPPLQRRYLHAMTVAHGLPTVAGGGLGGRPGVDHLQHLGDGGSGLWLAGDWVGEEGLLADASVASAVAAVQRILRGAASCCRPRVAV